MTPRVPGADRAVGDGSGAGATRSGAAQPGSCAALFQLLVVEHRVCHVRLLGRTSYRTRTLQPYLRLVHATLVRADRARSARPTGRCRVPRSAIRCTTWPSRPSPRCRSGPAGSRPNPTSGSIRYRPGWVTDAHRSTLRQPGCMRVSTTYFESTRQQGSGVGGVETHRHDRQIDVAGLPLARHARERYNGTSVSQSLMRSVLNDDLTTPGVRCLTSWVS